MVEVGLEPTKASDSRCVNTESTAAAFPCSNPASGRRAAPCGVGVAEAMEKRTNGLPIGSRLRQGALVVCWYHDRYRAGVRKAHVRHEATRVHHAHRRRGSVAARGARAAAGDAGSRVSWLYLGGYSRHSKIADGVPPSVEKRSCRRTSSATRAGLGLGLPIIGKLLACMMQHTIDGKCHERHCRVARIDRPE
jgi:hypothetical protein